ncbi:MAG: leucine-rich repeat protein [Clostridia bacterium]|nr:leucine-rich repeat protein [Clostridia bacterium]
MKRIFMLFTVICIALLLPVASAEEISITYDEVDLYIEGKFPEESGISFFGTTDELADYIYEQLTSLSTQISVRSYGLTIDVIKPIYQSVVNSHPEMFYVTGGYKYGLNSENIVTNIYPGYIDDMDNLESRIASFDSTVSGLASYARGASTTVGQLLRLNDYFCVNYSYGGSHRPDLLFRNGVGVCQAYTLAYSAVLNELGIPNVYAPSDSMNHIWNVVQVNGSWYHIDVTWNDPTSDMALRACHEHFLRSDSGIANSGHHSWTSTVSASSSAYDSFFWKDINTPLSVVGDVVYYIPSSGPVNGSYTIYRWPIGGSSSEVATFSIAKSDGSYSYNPGYAAVCADGNGVYYGTNGNIYAIDHSGSGEPRLVYPAGDESMNFYSAWMSGSNVRMLAGADLSSASVISCGVGGNYAVEMDAVIHIDVGEEMQLAATVTPELDFAPVLTWTSSSENAVVTEGGVITGVAPGYAEITAKYADGVQAICKVAVHAAEVMRLPASIKTVDAEAFSGTAPVEVVIPEGAETIGAAAFADCAELVIINIPDTVTEIAADAFTGCSDLTIICGAGSRAEEIAAEIGSNVIAE